MDRGEMQRLLTKYLGRIDTEAVVRYLYEILLEPGDFAVDIGAHTGMHTLPMAQKVGGSGRVFAFEPLPQCRQVLCAALMKNTPLLNVVTLLPFALSNYCGEASFVVAVDDLSNSGLRERIYDKSTRLESITVSVRRLDALNLPLPSLRFIKIDVEGGEYDALIGARERIYRCKPVITFECGESAFVNYGVSRETLLQEFFDLGYDIYDIKCNHVNDVQDFIEGARQFYVWDYIAVPQGRSEVISQLHEAYIRQLQHCDGLLNSDYKTEISLLDQGGISYDSRVSVPTGHKQDITVRVSNRGTCEFSHLSFIIGQGLINLGILWWPAATPRQRSALVAEYRVSLPWSLPPDETMELAVPLSAVGADGQPLPPGEYEVWLGLVHEGITWFYEKGDIPLKLLVDVC